PGEATSFSAMPVFDDDPAVKKIDASSFGTADTAPVTEIPKELRKPLFAPKKPNVDPLLPPIQQRATLPPLPMQQRATLPPLGAEKRPGELPSLPTAIVSRPELSALPTAIVAPSLVKPDFEKPKPMAGPSSTVELSAAAFEEVAELQPQATTLLPNVNQV